MSAACRLPERFAALEGFAEAWCLPTETARYAKRLGSSMPEMQAFYDAFSPRLEEAIDHCNRFPLDGLPDDAGRLLQLIYSLIMVAMSIEVFHQPKAVNAADARLTRIVEPVP